MSNATQTMREMLFGDMPLDEWVANASGISEPWASFTKAHEALSRAATDEAEQALLKITSMSKLEARMTLQAWTALRALGREPPPEIAGTLMGVVIEVGMKEGLDLLAAYLDGTARYWNYSGRGVVWERPTVSLEPHVNRVLAAARTILPNIGVWDGPRRPPPEFGMIRLNMLTPAGIAFGEGPFEVLAKDPMAKPLIDAATNLMQQLTELTRR